MCWVVRMCRVHWWKSRRRKPLVAMKFCVCIMQQRTLCRSLVMCQRSQCLHQFHRQSMTTGSSRVTFRKYLAMGWLFCFSPPAGLVSLRLWRFLISNSHMFETTTEFPDWADYYTSCYGGILCSCFFYFLGKSRCLFLWTFYSLFSSAENYMKDYIVCIHCTIVARNLWAVCEVVKMLVCLEQQYDLLLGANGTK